MPPRFFVPAVRSGDVAAVLPPDEAQHLRRVLRLVSGDRVHVFNGRGGEWLAAVADVSSQSVSVHVQEPVSAAREARVALTLAACVLKADKMDEVIRDAVMLGVTALQPVLSARTESSRAALERGRRTERWLRISVVSAKQCGRAVVPAVHAVATFDEVVSADVVMLCEPGLAQRALPLRALPPRTVATLLVGPEGGWTADEVARAEARGATLLTLGAQTLRAESVPTVALTALRVAWGDL